MSVQMLQISHVQDTFGCVLFQLFENSEIQIMADSQYDAQTRIQVLLEYLHEREMDLEDMAEQKRIKLEQCVQLRHFETEARQVRRNKHSQVTNRFPFIGLGKRHLYLQLGKTYLCTLGWERHISVP